MLTMALELAYVGAAVVFVSILLNALANSRATCPGCGGARIVVMFAPPICRRCDFDEE